jgi:hypothetical protein
VTAERKPARNAAPDAVRFPKLYAGLKWGIVGTLTILGLLAAAFWTMVLGGFAGSGFHAAKPMGRESENLPLTPECAWPYKVDDPDASAVCKMFYNLTAEQRAEVLRKRSGQSR